MATAGNNLSAFSAASLPSAAGMRIAIVVAEWNSDVTSKLRDGALRTLESCGCSTKDVFCIDVPGTFELSLGAQWLAETGGYDAVLCLGCVIQGETPHFNYICEAVSQGITNLNLKYNIPFIFGVLTTLSKEQALDRAGGKHGNKGDEAAATAIKMVHLKRSLTR
ncbi:MAG: 6,7-dimethyl-8-ribityllumazine synthase [Bacteroidales bacterium]